MSRKSEKLRKRIDETMAQVPALPKGFEKWLSNQSRSDGKFIFYKKIGKKIHGVCSTCGAQITLKKATHNSYAVCPECRTLSKLKAINKAKYYRSSEIMTIMQKIKEGYVIRYFRGIVIYKHGEDTSNFPNEILETLTHPKFEFYEGAREIITFSTRGASNWEEFEEEYDRERGHSVWVKERKRSMFYNKELLRSFEPIFYKRNLKRLLKDSKWKYCGLDHYKGKKMNIGDYIYAYEKENGIEFLAKLGFNNLLREVVHSLVHGGNPVVNLRLKRLGFSKEIFDRALRLDIGSDLIRFLIELEERGYKITDDQLEWAVTRTRKDVFMEMLEYTTAHKIRKYLEKQGSQYSYQYEIITWRDYMSFCKSLGKDIKSDFVIFPKNLKEKHDEYSQLIEMKKDELRENGIKHGYEKWHKLLNFESRNLSIVVASNSKEIMKEGDTLRHCVYSGTYLDKILKGDALILFIRKDNKPYYTVELGMKTFEIIQCRGFKNCNKTKEIEQFISKWKLKRLLPLKENKNLQRVI